MNWTAKWGAIFMRAYALAVGLDTGPKRDRAMAVATYARARYLRACRNARGAA